MPVEHLFATFADAQEVEAAKIAAEAAQAAAEAAATEAETQAGIAEGHAEDAAAEAAEAEEAKEGAEESEQAAAVSAAAASASAAEAGAYVAVVLDPPVVYETLAEAEADIASITVNHSVIIYDDGSNNGTYYKATIGATELTLISTATIPSLDASVQALGEVMPATNEGLALIGTFGNNTNPGAPVSHVITDDGYWRFPAGLDRDDMPIGPGAKVIDPIFDMPYVRTTEDGLYVISYIDAVGVEIHSVDATEADSGGGDEPAVQPAYASGSDFIVVPNVMWSQWIYPYFNQNRDGTTWWGSVSCGVPDQYLWGRINIAYVENDNPAQRTTIGRIEDATEGIMDDHNKGATLLDTRTGATYPLMVFQTDHAKRAYIRWWKGTTFDPADLLVQTNIASAGTKTYQQVTRITNAPDNIWILNRHSGGSADGNWSIYTSVNNGGAWVTNDTLFEGGGLYVAWMPAADGLGMHMMFYGHPTNGVDKVIRAAKLLWNGQLNGYDGTLISADIFAEPSPINPFVDAGFTTVYDPATKLTRYFDMFEFGGELHFVFAEFSTASTSTYDGNYLRAVVDINTGSSTVTVAGACGGKIDTGANASYIAGAALVDATHILASRWWGTYGDVVMLEFDGLAWNSTTVDRQDDRKMFRPIISTIEWYDSGRINYLRGHKAGYLRGKGADGGYTDFYHNNADGIFFDVEPYL